MRPFKKINRIDFNPPTSWQQLSTIELCYKSGIATKLEEKGWLGYMANVKTFVNPRIKRALGYANYRRGTIELNKKYFSKYSISKKNLERKMLHTFVHEVAHHLTYEFLEYRGHGRIWKEVMIWLGYKPERLGDLRS